MGQKDITEKVLEDYNDVFADIINGLLFDGVQEIKHIDQRCEGLLDVEIKIVHEVRHTPRGKYIWAICNIEQ